MKPNGSPLVVPKIFKCHPNVRWKEDKDTKQKVLQQAWVCVNTVEVEWRDVPTINDK